MQQASEFEYPFREFRKLKMTTARKRQLAGAKFRENETEKVDAHHFSSPKGFFLPLPLPSPFPTPFRFSNRPPLIAVNISAYHVTLRLNSTFATLSLFGFPYTEETNVYILSLA